MRNGVITPGVSAGSNHVGASVMFSTKVIRPSAAAARTGAESVRARVRTRATAEAGDARRAMGGLPRSAVKCTDRTPDASGVESGRGEWAFLVPPGGCGMARPVAYPESIEPLVRFAEETAPEHIVARPHHPLAAGPPGSAALRASGRA